MEPTKLPKANVKGEMPKPTVETTTERQNGWKFEISKTQILKSTELDELSEVLKLQRIPDIVYGKNYFELHHEKTGFTYSILASDSLSYVNFARLKEALMTSYGPEKKTEKLDAVQIEPSEVKVKESKYWQNKKVPEDADIKVLEKISNWTYSTPYKGTILVKSTKEEAKATTEKPKEKEPESKEVKEVKEEKESAEGSEKKTLKVYLQETDEEIPVKRLGMDNPILWGDQTVLFEDELDDSGLSQSTFRFRTMKDCFFGLLRFYLRVDEVIIRIYDTRIFHDFKTNYILREFQVRENSYEDLRKKGFKFSSEFNMNHQQSDLVYPSCDMRYIFRDKVVFE